MDVCGLHPKVTQALNGAQPGAIEAASAYVVEKLLGSASASASPPDDVPTNVVDAVGMVMAMTVQQRLAPPALEDLLSTSSSLRGDAVRAMVAAYASRYSEVLKGTSAAENIHEDGFVPRVSGMSWCLGHALGDRMLDPPSKSLPAFEIALSTYDHIHNVDGEVKMTLSAERLVDLHDTVRDMLKEAERVARGAS